MSSADCCQFREHISDVCDNFFSRVAGGITEKLVVWCAMTPETLTELAVVWQGVILTALSWFARWARLVRDLSAGLWKS